MTTVITVPVLQPRAEAAAKKKESTIEEKLAYYQKQIKKLKGLRTKVQNERDTLVKGSKEYIANLELERKYIKQTIYYSEKILELYK